MSIRCTAAGRFFHLLFDLDFVDDNGAYKSKGLLAAMIFLWILANTYLELFKIGFVRYGLAIAAFAMQIQNSIGFIVHYFLILV